MRKNMLQACAPAGLLIYVIFRIANHYTVISDAVARPAFIISVTLMLVGIAYAGWCIGRRVTQCQLSEDKKAEEQSK